MEMSLNAAASAMDLIRRRQIAAESSLEFGNFVRPFSYFFSNFHMIDLSCVRELNDAVSLFHEMLRMRPHHSVFLSHNSVKGCC